MSSRRKDPFLWPRRVLVYPFRPQSMGVFPSRPKRKSFTTSRKAGRRWTRNRQPSGSESSSRFQNRTGRPSRRFTAIFITSPESVSAATARHHAASPKGHPIGRATWIPRHLSKWRPISKRKRYTGTLGAKRKRTESRIGRACRKRRAFPISSMLTRRKVMSRRAAASGSSLSANCPGIPVPTKMLFCFPLPEPFEVPTRPTP